MYNEYKKYYNRQGGCKNMNRCGWVNLKNELYIKYHDTEWGVPTHDEHLLYELLILESFQAGLSWECVLNKREAFRKAFDNFDATRVANFDSKKVDELMNNASIIRCRRKILAQGRKGSPWVCFHITYITPLLNYDMVEESFQDWQHLTLAIFERQAEMSYYSCKKIVKNAHSFGNCTIW